MCRKSVESSFRLAIVLLALSLLLASQPSHAATVGGVLSGNTVWTAAQNPYAVTSSITVASGGSLTVQAGVVVALANGTSLSAQANAAIDVQGSAANPVQFIPQAGATSWGTISASGANASVTIRHAEIAHGGVNLGSQATGLIEDTYVHDVTSAIVANAARSVTMRRIHVSFYGETIFNSGTIVLAEDSLFENMSIPSADALEIQNGPPGSIIRRCTFRHSTGSNSDSVDCNGSTNVLVLDCLIYDFSDKGCSFGTATAFNQPAAVGMVVSNCLIYGVDTCVAVKDKSNASLFHNTLVNSANGVRLYQKYGTPVAGGGGVITSGYDNIIWGNGADTVLATNTSMACTYSDIGGTNWPGAGNISNDPLFLNVALRDYRLSPNSPAAGAGRDGGNMGAQFPVGAPMASSHPRIGSATVANGVATVQFWGDSEKSYTLQSSSLAHGGTWTTVTNVPTRALPVFVEAVTPVAPGSLFFRLLTP